MPTFPPPSFPKKFSYTGGAVTVSETSGAAPSFDVLVKVNRAAAMTSPIAGITTVTTSQLASGPWMSNTRLLGWRANYSGSGATLNDGKYPIYEADGTSNNPGPSVTQTFADWQTVTAHGGMTIINACLYNSSTGNLWPLPSADMPSPGTTDFPYFGHSASPATGAIPYIDNDGYFLAPSGYTTSTTHNSGNPWATLDLKMMQSRALTNKSKIIVCCRSAPTWLTGTWNACNYTNATDPDPGNDTPLTFGASTSDPNNKAGGPPLWMNVQATGTASASRGFAATITNVGGISAGATSCTIAVVSGGLWALTDVGTGDKVTFDEGTAIAETVTLTSASGASTLTWTGGLANAHGNLHLVTQNCGTRVISGFWGGNAATSGQATKTVNGSSVGGWHTPAVGQPWTFFDLFARMCQHIAYRYPWVQVYMSWGEPNNGNSAAILRTDDNSAWGPTSNVFWNDDGSNYTLHGAPVWSIGGRNSAVAATVLYNYVWQAIRVSGSVPGRNYATSPLTMGGPYWAVSYGGSGLQSFDDAAMATFFKNCAGLDFTINDGMSIAGTTVLDPSPVLGCKRAYGLTGGTSNSAFGLIGIVQAMQAKALSSGGYSGKPHYVPESYFDSNTQHLDYSDITYYTGTSGKPVALATNWVTSEAQALLLSTILYYHLLGGVAFVGRWQAQGETNNNYSGSYHDPAAGGTYNCESWESATVSTDSGSLDATVLGQPFKALLAAALFQQYFGPGTALKAVTINGSSTISGNGAEVLALASSTHTLLINQQNTALTIGLSVDNGATYSPVSMNPYDIVGV